MAHTPFGRSDRQLCVLRWQTYDVAALYANNRNENGLVSDDNRQQPVRQFGVRGLGGNGGPKADVDVLETVGASPERAA
jgi:hypothetical protein